MPRSLDDQEWEINITAIIQQHTALQYIYTHRSRNKTQIASKQETIKLTNTVANVQRFAIYTTVYCTFIGNYAK